LALSLTAAKDNLGADSCAIDHCSVVVSNISTLEVEETQSAEPPAKKSLLPQATPEIIALATDKLPVIFHVPLITSYSSTSVREFDPLLPPAKYALLPSVVDPM
jgi:hypothetical protein